MKTIIEKVKVKKIIPILFALITYLTLCKKNVLPLYDPLSWLLLLLLIMFYYKINLYNKEFFKSSIIYAIIFSLFLSLGSIVYENILNAQASIWRIFFSFPNLFVFFGLCITFYALMINIFPKLYNYDCIVKFKKKSNIKIFMVSFFIILLCWLPYFLALFPGELSVDSMAELNIIVNDFTNMSNHHPMIHVLFIAIPFKIGMFLFNDINLAVACFSIIQMIVMSSIFSYLITYLYKMNVNTKIIIICLLYFAIIPMHGYYSVTMWKDVIFSGLMVLLIIKLIRICDKNNELKFKDLISFIVLSLLVVLFRNNAIYMYFILIIIMMIVLKKYLKILILSFLIVLVSYYTITGPVFNALNIEKSASSEYIAIPLQQIGRMAYKDVNFNKNETKMLNKLMGVKNLKKYYVPQCVDGIKFNKNYNKEYFDKNKLDFLKLWLQLVIKHPSVALEAYAVSTLGYWYPGVLNWTVYKGVVENANGVVRNPKGPKLFEKYVNNIESRNIPIINMTWSTSLSFWILSIFCYICIKKRGIKYLLAYVPVFGIWLTMMVASPVFAEFRYIYSSYTCLPLLMLLPYIRKN